MLVANGTMSATTSGAVYAPTTGIVQYAPQVLQAPAITTVAAPMTTTVAAPATTMLSAPATTYTVPAQYTSSAYTVPLPQSTSMLAYQPAQTVTQSPYQFQFLPAASSVTMTAPTAVTASTAKAAVAAPTAKALESNEALRVTIVPVKAGSQDALTTFLNGNEVGDELEGLAGWKLGEAFFDGDKMVVMAKYDKMENLETGSAVNAKLLGQQKENLAGAPARYSGHEAWSYKGRGKSTGETAFRVTLIPIKPGSESAILDIAKSSDEKFTDKAFDGCLDITTFFSEDKLVAVARYSNMQAMEAAAEKVQEIMKPMGPYFAGAPDRMCGSVAWTTSTKVVKKTKKGCC